ncbi:MAG: hypothetical protein FWC91_12040 [Defluviitaleaceae bacterium]|nr:hypothetical protein [Defluviitaleaceae bacterium]
MKQIKMVFIALFAFSMLLGTSISVFANEITRTQEYLTEALKNMGIEIRMSTTLDIGNGFQVQSGSSFVLHSDIPLSITTVEDVRILAEAAHMIMELTDAALSMDVAIMQIIREGGELSEAWFNTRRELRGEPYREPCRESRIQWLIYLAENYTIEELEERGILIESRGFLAEFRYLGLLTEFFEAKDQQEIDSLQAEISESLRQMN